MFLSFRVSKQKIDTKLTFKESPSLQIELQELTDMELTLLLKNSPSIFVQFHSSGHVKICPGAKLYIWECDKVIDEKALLIKLPPSFPNLPAKLDGECFSITYEFSEDFTHLAKFHAAVECFKKRKLDYLLFPSDQTKYPNTKSITCSLPLKKLGTDLNAEQVSAMEAILLSESVLPVVIAGPFGTGKTFLLSQAAEYLVKHSKHCRILICTLTNSAANVYLDNFYKRIPSDCDHEIMRLSYKDQTATIIPKHLHKYFHHHYPSKSEVQKYRIILTTVGMVQELLKLNLTGYFTHIFIDEAAQMTVPEVMMALSLASNTTKVVMAGDHMQVSIAIATHVKLYSYV